MKINNNTFYCGWCDLEFNQKVNRVEGAGRKGTGVDMAKCPKCLNLISQKTKLELKNKYNL